jgi:antitoxin component YwqK of YwqJK toxin-antitoxin module
MRISKPSKKTDELLRGWHLIYPIVPSERDGPCEDYYENGQLKGKSTFVAGEVNVPYASYCVAGPHQYENGQLELRGTYVAGELDGPFEMYYENGQLQEKGTFAAGEPDGPYEAYDETGQLTTKGTCKEGFRVGKWIEDGKSKSYLFDQYERWAAKPGFGQSTVGILFIALFIWLIGFLVSCGFLPSWASLFHPIPPV